VTNTYRPPAKIDLLREASCNDKFVSAWRPMAVRLGATQESRCSKQQTPRGHDDTWSLDRLQV